MESADGKQASSQNTTGRFRGFRFIALINKQVSPGRNKTPRQFPASNHHGPPCEKDQKRPAAKNEFSTYHAAIPRHSLKPVRAFLWPGSGQDEKAAQCSFVANHQFSRPRTTERVAASSSSSRPGRNHLRARETQKRAVSLPPSNANTPAGASSPPPPPPPAPLLACRSLASPPPA